MSLRDCPWPVERVLPHAAPMILLDRVLGFDENRLIAEVVLHPGFPFATEEGLPAHVGIELMAQACGAFDGCWAATEGGPPKIGFLLGTRRYVARRPYLPMGARIEVAVRLVVRGAEMAVFECELRLDGDVVAEAPLSVFQPPNDIALTNLLSGKTP